MSANLGIIILSAAAFLTFFLQRLMAGFLFFLINQYFSMICKYEER